MTTTMRSYLGIVCTAVLIMAVPFAGQARAATSIAVVVNDQPITSYDVNQRMQLIKLTSRGGNLRERAIEELVNEKLQLAEAQRAGIKISDAEVDAALAQIASRIKLSSSQLTGALRQSGVNADTLRDRLRAQIAWGRLVRARFQATTPVREQDLIAALQNQNKATVADTTQYSLQQVTVVVPARAGKSAADAARSTALQLRNRFTDCEDGIRIARELKDIVVRPVGKRMSSEMPENLAAALDATQVGHLTAPEKDDDGYTMYAVCSKEAVRSSSAALEAIEGDVMSERGELFARQYLNTLRRDAVIDRR